MRRTPANPSHDRASGRSIARAAQRAVRKLERRERKAAAKQNDKEKSL